MNKRAKLPPMTMGQRIKELRQAKELSLVELSKLSGLTQPQLSNYENDANQPNSKMLLKLAEALDTTADYLLRGILPEKNDLLDGLEERNKSKVLEYIQLLRGDQKLKELVTSMGKR